MATLCVRVVMQSDIDIAAAADIPSTLNITKTATKKSKGLLTGGNMLIPESTGTGHSDSSAIRNALTRERVASRPENAKIVENFRELGGIGIE